MTPAELIEKYKSAKNKLILLDYDGTLVNFTAVPENAKPPAHLLEVLTTLSTRPHTKVIIITGRGHKDIDKFVGTLPIEIIAEHGAMIKQNSKWDILASGALQWKDTILPVLQKAVLDCPNTFIEEKIYSLVWHYRNTEEINGFLHSRTLIKELEKVLHFHDLKITDGNKVIEVISKYINKGNSVEYYLLQQNRFDFVLCIGDDKTDEDMFKVLLNNTNSYTFKVGTGTTFAKNKLDNVEDVISLLEQLVVCE